MKIEEIQTSVRNEEYEISLHAEKERYAENITMKDIEIAIADGEILEHYPDDPRGPSCLILGFSHTRPIHVICGIATTGWVRIITVYIPKLPKWIDPRTRTKGGEGNA